MDAEIRSLTLRDLVDPSQDLERIVTGFDFVEGPVWHQKSRSLIFSDILGNSIYRWNRTFGLQAVRKNSYLANGNTIDMAGRLVTCEHATSRVTRTDIDTNGSLQILATHYQGKELNSPNDIVCKSDGKLYFTDPNSGRSEGYGIPRPQELEFQGVYRLDPTDKNLTLLVDKFAKPNGLCFDPVEKNLYINDSETGQVHIYEVKPGGLLEGGSLWAELTGDGPGVADGMKVDCEGNLYCAGPGGIHVLDSTAKYLGLIRLPEQAANLAWGDDGCSLYITATTSIYRFKTLLPGITRQ